MASDENDDGNIAEKEGDGGDKDGEPEGGIVGDIVLVESSSGADVVKFGTSLVPRTDRLPVHDDVSPETFVLVVPQVWEGDHCKKFETKEIVEAMQ